MRSKEIILLKVISSVLIILMVMMNVIPAKAASPNMWLKKYYLTVNVGKTGTIGIKHNSTGKKVTYASSNKKIATVSNNGVVTGLKAGKATITVTAGNVSRKCIVTVKSNLVDVKSVEFQYELVGLSIGETYTSKITILPSNASNKNLTYISSNTSIVTVDKDGKLIGISEGKAIITAKATNGVKGTLEVEVSGDIYIGPERKPEVMDSSLKINQGTIQLNMTKDKLTSILGEPNMIMDSEFGCPVYVYNSDYSSLLFVYVKDNKVVGYYTNAATFETCGFDSSFTLNEVAEITVSGATCMTSEYNAKMWYDMAIDEKIIGVLVMIPSMESDTVTTTYLPTAPKSIIDNMERLSTEVINGFRGRNGISPLSYDLNASSVARAHSEDMTERRYFNHYTPEGLSPTARLKKAGMVGVRAAEIITMGDYLSTLVNIASFMSSYDHRTIMLDSNLNTAGPGISLGDGIKEGMGNVTVILY